MPKVSVIIPVFDRIEPLERAIQSVLRQSFTDFEIIVVDDHSTMDITSVANRYPTRYLKSVGKGVSAARNTGIRTSNSEWIAFLDSDDEWLPNKLELQMNYLSLNLHCEFVHSNEKWFRNGHPVTQKVRHQKMGGRIFSQCTERCLVAPSSVVVRNSLLSRTGLFDECFPVCEDFDLWLRIASDVSIGFIKEPLVIKHGGHKDQLSIQFHSMDLWRVRALVKHVEKKNLSSSENLALRKSLKKKCEILIKGFHKHSNFKNLNEIQKYLESIN